MTIRLRHGRLLASLAACAAAILLATTAANAQNAPRRRGPPAYMHVDLAHAARTAYPGGVSFYPDITYKSVFGFRPLKLDLYVPANKTPKPAVIWVHGGGWFVGDPRMPGVWGNWPKVLARLAARGYVVAGVSYRLSGAAKFPAQIQDVKSAIRWLRINAHALGIDPNRIAAWGGSAGGQLVSLAGVSCGDKAFDDPTNEPGKVSSCVQAVVDWYGPADFLTMDKQALPGSPIKHDSPTSPESRYLGCLLSKCPLAQVHAASPVMHVAAHEPPFLIMNGDDDHSVAPGQDAEFYKALKAKGNEARHVVLHGVDHGFAHATDAQKKMILKTVFAFLDRTMKHPTRTAGH